MNAPRERFGPAPIPSSQFGFDPFALSDSVRRFYERWHAQGGQSARDCAGIMKRARDLHDLRTDREKESWQTLDWNLRQRAAWLRLRTLGAPKRVKVVQFHSMR
jgi:hypothetical protein